MDGITIYTDGAARGNPGRSASGYMIYLNGRLAARDSVYNGIATNNYAEYRAVILAMGWCIKNLRMHSESSLVVYSDSELVVRQLNHEYKIKSKKMLELADEALELAARFSKASFKNVPRSERHIAAVDRALNDLLDSMGK